MTQSPSQGPKGKDGHDETLDQAEPWSYRLKVTVVGALALALVRLLHATYRYRYHGLEHKRAAEAKHNLGAHVLAVWHTNCFAALLSHVEARMNILISRSFDGEIIARCAEGLGLGTIRGSSRRGGRAALMACHRAITKGGKIGITVDGPTGPRFKVKAGAVDMARRHGVAILPVIAVGQRMWVFRSWDRFRLPKPFTRIDIHYGPPIMVPTETSSESFQAAQAEVEKRLMDLEAWAASTVPHFPA